jgi:hypothetical protein
MNRAKPALWLTGSGRTEHGSAARLPDVLVEERRKSAT